VDIDIFTRVAGMGFGIFCFGTIKPYSVVRGSE